MTLEEIFAGTLHVPVTSINDETSPGTLRNWNSLRHIQLVTALEKQYRVEFSTPEILGLQSVGQARDLLRSKGCQL